MTITPAAAPAVPAASPAPVKEPAVPVAPAATPTSALEPTPPPAAPGAPSAAPAAPAQTWPDDWREQIYGSDQKLLARLQRYGSVKDVANALVAAQNRISSGE